MSREIKFRIIYLNKEEKEAHGGKPKYWSAQNECACLAYVMECEDYIVSEYTGLKDKNGKEIYEGDIFRRLPDVYVAQVYYEEATFRWKRGEGEVLKYNLSNLTNDIDNVIYKIEVIGNIYENPELLQEAT